MAEESVSDLPLSRRFLKSLFGDNDAVRKIEFFYFIIVYSLYTIYNIHLCTYARIWFRMPMLIQVVQIMPILLKLLLGNTSLKRKKIGNRGNGG